MKTLRPLRVAVSAAALLLAISASPHAQAETLRIAGTGAALGTMSLLAAAYAVRHPDIDLDVLPSIGSSGGIKAVLDGSIHLAVTSRSLNDAERAAGANQIEYARTPLVFATSARHGTDSITTPELADIYAGRNEQWPSGGKIRLVLRPIGDADTDTVRNMSPAMHEAVLLSQQRKGLSFAVTDQEAADNLESIPGAVGPASLALILSERRALKALRLDGVTPTAASLADGSYPLSKTFYMVLGRSSSQTIQDFISFVRSQAGREVLMEHGHWVR